MPPSRDVRIRIRRIHPVSSPSTTPSGSAPGTAPAAVPAAAPANQGARGRLLDEARGLLLPVVMPVVRRLPAIILSTAGLVTLVGALVLIGAAKDDALIAANSAVATAEVLPGSDMSRTLIRFTTDDGQTVIPERGVFYPRGLEPGQLVKVEYDSTHPDRVRVLGRDVSIGYWPIGLMIAIFCAVTLPIAFHLRGRQLRRLEEVREAAERLAKERAEQLVEQEAAQKRDQMRAEADQQK